MRGKEPEDETLSLPFRPVSLRRVKGLAWGLLSFNSLSTLRTSPPQAWRVSQKEGPIETGLQSPGWRFILNHDGQRQGNNCRR